MKSKKTSSESKVATQTVTKTREKKVYSLPGQKYQVPEEREPLRIFYESLSKQIPSSEMAEFWLMEHGMLSPERAKKAYGKKQMKQKQLRAGGTSTKQQPSSCPPTTSDTSKDGGATNTHKRVLNDDDSDNDEVVLTQKPRKK